MITRGDLDTVISTSTVTRTYHNQRMHEHLEIDDTWVVVYMKTDCVGTLKIYCEPQEVPTC